MKLLSIIPVMGVGGAEAVAATLAIDALTRGHEVELASAAGGFRIDLVRAAGIAHLDIPLDSGRPGAVLRSAARVRAAVRGAVPDLVHAHNVKAAVVSRLALGTRAPVVTTLHGVPADQVGTAARLLRWSSRHVVAVSPYVATQLTDRGYPVDRLSVIENAMAPLPDRPRTRARARLGLAEETTVALCLARMVDQKRHDLLIEAWRHTPGGATLLLAGDGPRRPELEHTATRLGIADRVRFLGERDDVDWLLAAADLSVLATDWEGLPISMLEAMAAGLPVVVSRVGGVVETLGSGVRLVEPGSATALAQALLELILDPGKRVVLGRRGQELVASRFGRDRMLDRYDRLFCSMARTPVGSAS